jgi:hypothetical protein
MEWAAPWFRLVKTTSYSELLAEKIEKEKSDIVVF